MSIGPFNHSVFCAVALAFTAGPVEAAGQPNIIVFLTDDQGYGDLGCFGSDSLETPNIDRLCRQGMRFTDFYVHQRCSPTRLAFMTGSHAHRAGCTKVIYHRDRIGIHDDEATTPELLRKAGYATGIVGKWHLGEWDAFNPVRHGFDFFHGFMIDSEAGTGIYRNLKRIGSAGKKTDGAHTPGLLDAAMGFIRENKEQPFFLYYASPLPHTPWIPMERFKGTSTRGAYGDVIREIDWQVGELMNTLDEWDLPTTHYSSSHRTTAPFSVLMAVMPVHFATVSGQTLRVAFACRALCAGRARSNRVRRTVRSPGSSIFCRPSVRSPESPRRSTA